MPRGGTFVQQSAPRRGPGQQPRPKQAKEKPPEGGFPLDPGLRRDDSLRYFLSPPGTLPSTPLT